MARLMSANATRYSRSEVLNDQQPPDHDLDPRTIAKDWLTKRTHSTDALIHHISQNKNKFVTPDDKDSLVLNRPEASPRDPTMEHVRKFAKLLTSQQNCTKLPRGSTGSTSTRPGKRRTLWDIEGPTQPNTEGPTQTVPRLPLVSFEDLKTNRIPLERLMTERKFANYVRGTTSNVLYVKNLRRNVTSEHLASVFGNFGNDVANPTYKVLRGKMRGQAFVTFPCAQVASRALDQCQGFVLSGQPIVISFARSSDQ